MADRLGETMDGTLGHFWMELGDVYDLKKGRDGYVRLVDGGLFHVGTLRTLDYNREFGTNQDRLPQPESIYAMTSSTRAIFFDIAGISQSNVMGQRASTQTVRTRGVVVNVPFVVLKDDKFLAVELEIPQVTRWAGLTSIRETLCRPTGNRPKQYKAEKVDVEPLELDIRPGFKLKLDSTWHVDGPDDKRTINAPLVVGTSSRKPRKWHDHFVLLLSVQDLISLAHEGFVPAERATVAFQINDDGRPRETPERWNSRLMALPPRGGVAKPKSMNEVPLFYLGQIGGVRGLRNWIRLDHEHARATGPITNAYRYGTAGVEVHLIEIATGMEYWTKVHRQLGRAWAQPRRVRGRTNEALPMSIGRHVGPAFAEFVGDLDQWSQLFWDTYNSLKHAPNYEYNASEVQLLGDTGELLLLGALLNRVAGNKVPMKVLCQSHRTHMLGYNTRKLLGAGEFSAE
jgi:ApeA-like protein